MGARPPDEVLLASAGSDVLVVTVKAVESAAATNGHPPRLMLHVDEVLRGQSPTGPTRALWAPDEMDAFHAQRDGGFAGLARWAACPYAPPPVASRWIVTGEQRSGSADAPAHPFVPAGTFARMDGPYLHVHFAPRLPYTEANRALATSRR